jgi:hypothetical protein
VPQEEEVDISKVGLPPAAHRAVSLEWKTPWLTPRVQARLRCERQVLHRLPKTKALLFSVKTYLYRLEDVKAEGSANALIQAIDGIRAGSVPDFYYYKRAVVWGEPVKEYLRS